MSAASEFVVLVASVQGIILGRRAPPSMDVSTGTVRHRWALEGHPIRSGLPLENRKAAQNGIPYNCPNPKTETVLSILDSIFH
jgi:hypothetical protein